MSEVAIELPLALALYSAFSAKALPHSVVSLGELSLAGEVRPVGFGDRRAKGALDMGYTTILVPRGMQISSEINVLRCESLEHALALVERLK